MIYTEKLLNRRKKVRTIWCARILSTLVLLPTYIMTYAQTSTPAAPPVTLNLQQAIELALKQNNSLRLARLAVEESRQKKVIARASYFPQIKNESAFLHLTELAGVTIPAGAFGVPSSTGPIPGRTISIAQGSLTTYTSGTGLTQPVTQMFKIYEANRAATADLHSAGIRAEDTTNAVVLAVRQVYYGILIAEQKRAAAQESMNAFKLKSEESTNAVAEGRALEVAALEARASVINAQQELLTLDLEISDLYARFNELLDIPLDAKPHLDHDVAAPPLIVPSREEAIRLARGQSPDVRTAQQAVIKAYAGLAAAKDAYIPDVTGLSRYSYQSGVPFLVHNFGTFGFSLTYELFDGGKRIAAVKEAHIVLSEAELNLRRVQDATDVKIRAAYDKVARMENLTKVADQMCNVRSEAARLADQMFEQDAVLASAKADAHAKNTSAQASLLEAQLGLSLAQGELLRTIGRLAN